MSASRATMSVIVVLGVILWSPAAARAQGVKLDDPDLARVSDVIVTGRVVGIGYGRDARVGYIYSYVTIEVDERIKGDGIGSRLVVKQLGGQIDDLKMVIHDQATFRVGEEVLLFLVARPRDLTLQTTGLWQGKWTINRDPVDGGRWVTRSPAGAVEQAGPAGARRQAAGGTAGQTVDAARPLPSTGVEALEDFRLLGPFLAELDRWSTQRDVPAAVRRRFDTQPAAVVDVRPAFNLLGPARWNQPDSGAVVSVDIQDSGEPGLAGGGFSEIRTARMLWNGTGSSMLLAAGNRVLSGASPAALCTASEASDTGRLTIYFADPCDEIADDGTLAVGGFFSRINGGATVNGTRFDRIVGGVLVTSDESGAQSPLNNSRCFQDVQTHEIGHAIGIGHTSTPGNVMNASLDGACFAAAAAPNSGRIVAPLTGGLGNDDKAAINFIYPGAPGGPPPADGLPGAPRGLTFNLTADRVVLEWLPPLAGGTVTSYQIQGGSQPGRNNLVNFDTFQNATKINLTIGEGDYFIRVSARNAFGLSAASSNEVSFVVTGTPSVPNPVFVMPTINLTQNAAGRAVVMGEIQNRVVGAAATFIQVDATFMAQNGNEVGTRSAFIQGRSRRLRASGVVTDTALLPGQRGCFMITTNIPAAQVSQVLLGGSFSTAAQDPLLGRLRLVQLDRQEDSSGNLELVGTASNVGARTTFFNQVVFDVKNPQVQSCTAVFVNGSTIPVPGGGTTSTGLSPGQVGDFTTSTSVPFAPIEIRPYTQWDEAAPAGAGNALQRLTMTDQGAASLRARFETSRALLRRLMSGAAPPSALSLRDLRNEAEARLRELEERLASGGGGGPLSIRPLLPVRIVRSPRN